MSYIENETPKIHETHTYLFWDVFRRNGRIKQCGDASYLEVTIRNLLLSIASDFFYLAVSFWLNEYNSFTDYFSCNYYYYTITKPASYCSTLHNNFNFIKKTGINILFSLYNNIRLYLVVIYTLFRPFSRNIFIFLNALILNLLVFIAYPSRVTWKDRKEKKEIKLGPWYTKIQE